MVPWLFVLCLASLQDAPATEAHQDLWTVPLGPIQRVFQRATNGGWSTVALRAGDVTLPVTSREFALTLADGRVLVPEQALDVQTAPLRGDPDRQGQAVSYGFPDLCVVVEYFVGVEPSVAGKQLRLEPLDEGASLPVVLRWEVECWWADRISGGGRGLPGRLGDFWTGLEDPAAMVLVEEGGLRLFHGTRRRADRSAVAWMGREAAEGPAFGSLHALLAADLPRPRAVFHQDLAHGTTDTEIRDVLRRLLRHLSRSQGGRLDALVLDQGWWSDPGSLAPDPAILPEDGAPLSHALRDAGAGLGLGIPVQGDLSLDSERARLLGAVMGRLGRMPLTYVEHHVEAGPWSDPGRATENLLTLLQAERRFLPSSFLSLGDLPWPSPWWLRSFDGWREDLARSLPTPTGDPAWSWRTAEDALLWQRLQEGVPVERVTCDWPAEATTGWRDQERVEQFLWIAARGSRELTLPPDPPSWSQALGEDLSGVLRWCDDRQEVLDAPVRTVGGPPGSGRIHGYLHQQGERAILILRNPGLDPATWTLPALGSPWLVTWPWCELLAQDEVLLPAESVRCLETLATIRDLEDVPSLGRFRPGQRGPRRSTVQLWMAPGEERHFRWWGADPDGPESRVGLAGSSGRREPGEPRATPRLATALEGDRIRATVTGMGAWFGERWQVLVRYQGDPADLEPEDLEAEVTAREARRLADGWLWVLTPRAGPGDWVVDLPLGSFAGLWELRARRIEQWEVAEITRAHPLRSLGTPVLPPAARVHERVDEYLLGRVAPLGPVPSALDVPR